MYDCKNIIIEDKYLVREKSTSDGSQIKYYIDNKWYKLDYHGGEAESEYLSSVLLSFTNLDNDKFVGYEKAIINNTIGCISQDFRTDEEEEFVTLYRLYKNIYGKDLATITSKMDYDDAIMYVIEFVKKYIGLDITEYLANIFWLDLIILNTDRHFNNYGIIMCGSEFREAPIFDNGKSLFTGTDIDYDSVSINEVVRKQYSKSFSPDFKLNYNFLKEHCTIDFDKEGFLSFLEKQENTIQRRVLDYQLRKLA